MIPIPSTRELARIVLLDSAPGTTVLVHGQEDVMEALGQPADQRGRPPDNFQCLASVRPIVSEAPLDLDLPHYQQTLEVTCGAASLMMAMGGLDTSLELDEAMEIEIWREANLVEVWGTSREGLALAAHRRGFRARTQGDHAEMSFVDQIRDQLPGMDSEMLETMYKHTRRRFAREGLEDEEREVRIEDIESALRGGEVPVVLVDGDHLGHGDIPHWIAVGGLEGRSFQIEDPAVAEERQQISFEDLQAAIGYGETTCAVYVS